MVEENFEFWSEILQNEGFQLFLDPPTLEVVGPTDFGGWSYRLTPVRLSVCPCVCPEFFSKTDHRIFPKLGMKLKDNKGNKVTEPDFPKKIWIIQNFSKIWSKMRFFDFCRKSKSLTPTENDSTKCLWTPRENRISRKNLVLEILSCLQIIFVSKFHFWMILSQILGFRPFSWVYFADFAYYDRQAWYLAGIGGSVAEKKFPAQI